MSLVGVDPRVKRRERGGGCRRAEPHCMRHFLEFAIKIGVFIVQIFQFHLKELSFPLYLRKKLNYLVFDLHFINNNLRNKWFFPKSKSRICNFFVLFTLFLSQKSSFTDQSQFFTFLSSPFSCYWCHEICCCKIFGSHDNPLQKWSPFYLFMFRLAYSFSKKYSGHATL